MLLQFRTLVIQVTSGDYCERKQVYLVADLIPPQWRVEEKQTEVRLESAITGRRCQSATAWFSSCPALCFTSCFKEKQILISTPEYGCSPTKPPPPPFPRLVRQHDVPTVSLRPAIWPAAGLLIVGISTCLSKARWCRGPSTRRVCCPFFFFAQVSHFCGECREGFIRFVFFLSLHFLGQIWNPQSVAERLQLSLTSPFALLNNNNTVVFFCLTSATLLISNLSLAGICSAIKRQ